VTRRDETPADLLARWTATDAALGVAAEAEQLRAQLAERSTESADLRARLEQLANRVAQLEAENAGLRRVARRVPLGGLAHRVYRRARASAARRLRR
jgi:chromosome segregation ATPase